LRIARRRNSLPDRTRFHGVASFDWGIQIHSYGLRWSPVATAHLGAQTVKRPAIAFARFYTTKPADAEKFHGDTPGYKRLEETECGSIL
jgi:hypothetical protein